MRRETVATGTDSVSERRILAKFEIMDGEPVRGGRPESSPPAILHSVCRRMYSCSNIFGCLSPDPDVLQSPTEVFLALLLVTWYY